MTKPLGPLLFVLWVVSVPIGMWSLLGHSIWEDARFDEHGFEADAVVTQVHGHSGSRGLGAAIADSIEDARSDDHGEETAVSIRYEVDGTTYTGRLDTRRLVWATEWEGERPLLAPIVYDELHPGRRRAPGTDNLLMIVMLGIMAPLTTVGLYLVAKEKLDSNTGQAEPSDTASSHHEQLVAKLPTRREPVELHLSVNDRPLGIVIGFMTLLVLAISIGLYNEGDQAGAIGVGGGFGLFFIALFLVVSGIQANRHFRLDTEGITHTILWGWQRHSSWENLEIRDEKHTRGPRRVRLRDRERRWGGNMWLYFTAGGRAAEVLDAAAAFAKASNPSAAVKLSRLGAQAPQGDGPRPRDDLYRAIGIPAGLAVLALGVGAFVLAASQSPVGNQDDPDAERRAISSHPQRAMNEWLFEATLDDGMSSEVGACRAFGAGFTVECEVHVTAGDTTLTTTRRYVEDPEFAELPVFPEMVPITREAVNRVASERVDEDVSCQLPSSGDIELVPIDVFDVTCQTADGPQVVANLHPSR